MKAFRTDMAGTALITALLVVALATTTAVAMLKNQHLDIRRASNIFYADQANLYAQSAEEWVIQVLLSDQQENKFDGLADTWARLHEPIDIEDGKMQIEVEDLQARFNLNNLIDKQGKPNRLELENLQHLLALLELDTDLVFPILDWIDNDVNTSLPGGAEDNEYLAEEPAYRTANVAFSSSSELLQVKGIGSEEYERLRPYVTALPGQVPVNVNTASALILASLVKGMDRTEAEAFVQARPEKGYESVETFLSEPSVNGQNVQGISVNSHYFSFSVDVALYRHQSGLRSILVRENNNGSDVVSILRRSRVEL